MKNKKQLLLWAYEDIENDELNVEIDEDLFKPHHVVGILLNMVSELIELGAKEENIIEMIRQEIKDIKELNKKGV